MKGSGGGSVAASSPSFEDTSGQIRNTEFVKTQDWSAFHASHPSRGAVFNCGSSRGDSLSLVHPWLIF